MKKKLLIVSMVILFGVFLIGGYAFINRIFPKAAPINVPTADDIISISITENNGRTVVIEKTGYEEFFQKISTTYPTRIMSVNDYLAVETYYTIEIKTSVKEYRYFMYADKSKVYIEIAYEGIYEADQQFLDFVIAHFETEKTK